MEIDVLNILAANLHGCSSTNSTNFQYGIKKTYERTGEKAQIIAMTETMSDAALPLSTNHATYISPGKGPGAGMCLSLDPDKLPSFKVEKTSPRIQVLSLIGFMNIISLYAPQMGKDDQEKQNFKKTLDSAITKIDNNNDYPILMCGDFNIDRSEILDQKCYLKETLQHGTVYGSGEITNRFGKELDFAVVLKPNPEHSISVRRVENATSDHDAIYINIENFNVQLDQDADLVKQAKQQVIPTPKPNSARKFSKAVRKKWNQFLHMRKDICKILDATASVENICKTCKKKNHHSLLDQSYEAIRNILIKTALEVQKPTKKKKKLPLHVYEKIHKRFCKREIGKRKFRKLLKHAVHQQDILEYKELSNFKSSKKFFSVLKKRMNLTDRTREPRIPLKGITKIYKEIYEPKSFTVKDVLKVKDNLKKIEPKTDLKVNKFTQKEITAAVKEVKRGKSSRGPKIELWAMANIEDIMLKISNAFLIHGHLPKNLLTANIKCLKKDHSLPDNTASNFRPIALVDSFSKVIELLMKNRITFSFSSNQYAYQKKKGTLNALKDFILTSNYFKKRDGICFNIFLDLSKAFDKLDFKAISNEMYNRMDLPTRRIFADYLTNTCTMLEEVAINPRRGIRQGGLLSPPIFLQTTDPWLRENNNVMTKHVRASGFADDTGIQGGIVINLQNCLDSFADFAEKNGLQLNPTKCKVVVCCEYKDYMHYISNGNNLPQFTLHGVVLEYVSFYKYLGYHYTPAMTDTMHLKVLLSKIRKAILQYKRFFKRAPISLLIRVAQSYIVSKLYGLEFSVKINKNTVNYYNYLFRRWFGRGQAETDKIIHQAPEINLEKLHEKARIRYENLDSQVFYEDD